MRTKRSFSDSIKHFYQNNKLLSVLLIANAIALIALKQDLFSIIFSVYILYFGGILFKQYLKNQDLIINYFLGGIAGLIFFILLKNPELNAENTILYTVFIWSAGISVLTGITTYVPDLKLRLFILGNLKIKYLTIGLIILNIIVPETQENIKGAHLSTLAGVLAGFIYISLTKKTIFNKYFSKTFDWFKKPAPDLKVKRNDERPLSNDEFNMRKNELQEEIDKILDKIKENGYDKLSKEEKEKLFRMSKKL